ncbi:UDP-N-acetylglucosamine 1-carboxyvinyltransferase [Candidatus Falkowbacteria bacterium CG10_big_fil_rev_8_21_14_0_10_43_10]|uniref:UDP-N-acetylglucosamine 1-carboxyvinyltransferase n=1 Tax=Candidatus Falkowbacteria bacterium CG10_big_fil_rev_8_21_14_0_10_43_10 TaxID=1974567 RepID=A0A2H0V1Q2_9BACT|nr:MAG: UDP-N-acetylglucosamine 1-carboxyvinyltransferase [Candidatus Falkowbacteria bacterium CG10_big_fil_rev_8_21_14_0_10_43_10]
MPQFIINGGKKLKGEIKIAGNKNAMLPVFAACLLTKEKCIIKNVPDIADGQAMLEILMSIGVKVERINAHAYSLQADKIKTTDLNPELTKKLRGCITLMGALTARFKKMSMQHPGGCLIGKRPLDVHLQVMEAFGANIKVGNSQDNTPIYNITNKNCKGANLFLEEQSVTATGNAIIMAVLAPGKTRLENAASEPHVRDLIIFLNKMGAKIKGAGTNTLEIAGVTNLRGASHFLVCDNVEAISFACLAAATKSHLKLTGIIPDDLKMSLVTFNKMGIRYKLEKNTLELFPSAISAVEKIQDGLWPALPTDAISPFIVLATQASGTTLIHQWMFEGRLFFIDKLIRMGAKIVLCDPHRALVAGPTKLRAKSVESPDIRAGIALLIAGLIARGTTTIDNIYQIERGYENIAERLRAVGADIQKK